MNMTEKNLTMIMDLYELTMANGIFTSDMRDTVTYFDMFFRRVPDDGGYAIMAGLEQLIEYMNNLRFGEDDIEYLKNLNLFSDEFIDYLKDFKFTCDVWAVPEGTVIFPHEPIVTVRGPAMQALMLETMLLLTIFPFLFPMTMTIPWTATCGICPTKAPIWRIPGMHLRMSCLS